MTCDATAAIQSAIEQVAQIPLDKNGFRGAVLLQPSDYSVYGSLKINGSGIVLRGSGAGEKGTYLIAAGKDRRTLITIEGRNDRRHTFCIGRLCSGRSHGINDCRKTTCTQSGGCRNYCSPLHSRMDKSLKQRSAPVRWRPGEYDIYFDRNITSVEGDRITFDAPITTALDKPIRRRMPFVLYLERKNNEYRY
ncbi:MAG: hypothetical protein LBH19_12830 [Dysgonamonadaceae bacterium]|jgi:hypothetical protein|nr:hypothetical protein [Dysgonamonadaceae bacterium]